MISIENMKTPTPQQPTCIGFVEHGVTFRVIWYRKVCFKLSYSIKDFLLASRAYFNSNHSSKIGV